MQHVKDILCNCFPNVKVNDEVEKNLVLLEEQLERIDTFHLNHNFSIFIEGMPKEQIAFYLEYLEEAFKRQDPDYEFIKISNIRDMRDYKDDILIVDVDEIEDFKFSWRFHDHEFLQLLIDSTINHNILIFTSVKPFDEYDCFTENDILHRIPGFIIREEKDAKTIYEQLLQKYQKEKINCHLSLKDFKEIYDSVSDNLYVCSFDTATYFYNYSIMSEEFLKKKKITKKAFSSFINEEEEEEEKKKPTPSLQQVVGLKNVKEELNQLFHYAAFMKKKTNSGEKPYLNMLFLGNPGTGKTMVGNMIANKFYKMGYLEENDVVKIVPNDLVGEYVGHTRRVTRDILKKAKGKLLFIDEAYLFCSMNYSKGKNPFMEEAMIELLKYLEDPSNIVIMAGYKEELRKIYDMNPGMKSRIYKEILFDDYSVKELYKILENELKKQGLVIDSKDKKEFMNTILLMKEDKNFGNARSMKQLAQKIIMNYANHWKKNSSFVIHKNDLPIFDEVHHKRMGFDNYDRK